MSSVTIDRSESPARLAFGDRFNACEWFVDRHLEEGRGEKAAIRMAGRDVSYASLAQNVARAAHGLSELGLGRGARIVMVLRDAPEFFYLFWGALRAGLVPVPVSYLFRATDLAYIVADSECGAVAYSAAFAGEAVPGLAEAGTGAQGLVVDGEGGFLTRIASAPTSFEAAPAGPDDVAFWLYSSGTTGWPKGVLHRHGDLAHTCEHYAVGVLGLDEGDACYSAARLFFAYGLGNAMSFPLWVGGTAILDPRRPTPATTFETIEALRPTVYFGVPTLYAAQLQLLDSVTEGGTPDAAPDLSSLRVCVSAGEALPAGLYRRWKEMTGLEIVDGIGSTEALHIFISNRPGDVRPGATGQVVPGYEARVVDEEGGEVPPGDPGRLEIRGASVTPGYWNRPERTAAALVDGWLRTGDQYVREADGTFRYQGRVDDMLKVGGIWCSPFDIEERLIEHEAVLEAAVVGREDENGLVKPEAWVVAAGGVEPDDELAGELARHCQEALPRYMYPRWVRFVDELPKTATGKIQRYRLRATEGADERTKGEA